VTFSWTTDKPKLARLHLDNKTTATEECHFLFRVDMNNVKKKNQIT
jgi:hypothetical protein